MDGEEGDAEVMNNEACFPSRRKDRYLLSITNNVKQKCSLTNISIREALTSLI